MIYKRNNDLNYYYDNPNSANCGSYALRLEGWYDPEDYFYEKNGDIDDWAREMLKSYDVYDVSNLYAETLIEGMLEEFKDELRLITTYDEVKSDEELILFCTFCFRDYQYDFHFKVFRNGKWMEKNGTGEVHETNEDDWGDYISDVWCLAHKIA